MLGNELDTQIAIILNIKSKKLLKLSPSKVQEFGGIEPFEAHHINLLLLIFVIRITEMVISSIFCDRTN